MISVFKVPNFITTIYAQDALIMNIDDLLCVGATGNIMISSTIGRNVSVMTDEGNVNGKAIKIDDDGALIISKGKKVKRILVGDITQ